MNEFKFSCPNCKQSIQATPEYSGAQITCPSCQASIVVPAAPAAPAAPAPKAGKLTMAASTVEHIVTSPVMATSMVRNKKKPNYALYVKIAVGLIVVIAAVMLTPKAIDKYHQHQADVAAAAAAAALAANPPPPPPPPELTADEIVKKLGATYKALNNLSLQGVSVGTIDYSVVSPANKIPVEVTTKLSLRLGRPDMYRMEWSRPAGNREIKGVVWNSGKGDIIRVGPAPSLLKNREQALNYAAEYSGTLGGYIAGLFFDETNSVATVLKNYAKSDSESLDNQDCYVLTGRLASQDLVFWIRKSDFLIVQSEHILGGKVDDVDLKGLSLAQKAQMERSSKLRGQFIEDYQSIVVGKTPLNPRDFESDFTPNATAKPRQMKREKPGKPGA